MDIPQCCHFSIKLGHTVFLFFCVARGAGHTKIKIISGSLDCAHRAQNPHFGGCWVGGGEAGNYFISRC